MDKVFISIVDYVVCNIKSIPYVIRLSDNTAKIRPWDLVPPAFKNTLNMSVISNVINTNYPGGQVTFDFANQWIYVHLDKFETT
jgi:hypothetical protein